MDMDNSVVIAGGEGFIRGLNGNGKIQLKKILSGKNQTYKQDIPDWSTQTQR